MDLKSYIQAARGNGTALAEALGIPVSYLSQMASGDRAITPERAAKIELLTDRQVMRWDSRPDDWQSIWPELVRVKATSQVSTPTYTGPDRRKSAWKASA